MVHSLRAHLATQTVWSSSSDKTVRVWDATTGTQQHVLQGHAGRVFCLLPIGGYVVSGSWDASLFVWDVKVFKRLRTGKFWK